MKLVVDIINFEHGRAYGYEEYLLEKNKTEKTAGTAGGKMEKSAGTANGNAAESAGSKEPSLEDVFDKKAYYNPGKIRSRLLKSIEKYEKLLQESEAKAADLQMKLLDPALASDYEKLMELQNQLDAEEHQQETLLERMMEAETELQELDTELQG